MKDKVTCMSYEKNKQVCHYQIKVQGYSVRAAQCAIFHIKIDNLASFLHMMCDFITVVTKGLIKWKSARLEF